MVGRQPDFGATAEAVSTNVKRFRVARKLSYTELSAKLKEAGSQITPVGVRRIEDGERRVTVDDLMTLAVALDVWPISLLMPEADNDQTEVTASGVNTPIPAEDLWGWLRSDRALRGDNNDWVETMHVAFPMWRVRQLYEAAAAEESRQKWLDAVGEEEVARFEKEAAGDGDH
jgi:transcriptional regulator with XRE-family HTH domain